MPTSDSTAHATSNGTRGFADRHAALGPQAYRSLGSTSLLVSGVGFGCDRLDDGDPKHARSLEEALRSGCNLITTAASDGDGAGERAVGRVLSALLADGSVARQEVVIVSKIGPRIDPDFLSEQIGASLARLGLDELDACLLNDPASGEDRAERREEFDARIRAAFARLEEECDAGRVRFYGVSSSGFVKPSEAADATPLTRMLEVAREVAVKRGAAAEAHRFRIVQFPFNLLEIGAITERNCGADLSRTVLEEAAEARLGVLINRPLSAVIPGASGGVVRLADFPPRAGGVDVEAAAAAVAVLEEEFEARIAPALEIPGAPPRQLFGWGLELGANARRFQSLLHWRQVEAEMLRPRLEHALEHVNVHLIGRPRLDWADWQARYRPAIETLLAAIGDLHGHAAQQESTALSGRLDPFLPEPWRGLSLSRKSIGVLLGSPGLSCVVVGMRSAEHVADALGALAEPAPSLPREAWRSLAAGCSPPGRIFSA